MSKRETAGGNAAGAVAGSTIRVVAVRTGLAMETLRAWERRYGFPMPERREGSNRRLYSSNDIERLVSIRRAIECGYRVGDVIGRPLAEVRALAGDGPAVTIPAPDDRTLAPVPDPRTSRDAGTGAGSGARSRAPGSHGHDAGAGAAGGAAVTVARLIELLARDCVAEIESALRREAGVLGPRRFVTEMAHPFAVAVGAAWADGTLTVRHEHTATECLVTQLRYMLAAYQDIEARPVVLLATLPGETHTLALEMVAVYLVVAGAKPRLLGGPTPVREVAEAVRGAAADVVGVTVTPTSGRKDTRAAVRALRAALPGTVAIWIGGSGAQRLELDGDGLRVVTSWSGIDDAVAEWRLRSRHAPVQ